MVGGGVMGCATARTLARSGRRTLLLERFDIGHRRGSSHGSARIFRLSYPDPVYVRMAQEALPLWHELEAEAGEPLLRTTGGIDVGAAVGDHARALAECGAVYEVVSGEEASRRFAASLARDEAALVQPDAGVLLADRAWRAFGRVAARRGAEIRERAEVTAVEPQGDGVRVRLRGGERLEAAAAVVTAGAWAAGLLEAAGFELAVRPTRETVAYFHVPRPEALPALVEWTAPAAYALPAGDGTLKAGLHGAGATVDPDAPAPVDPSAVDRVAAWVSRRFPGADGSPVGAETCLYTNTVDSSFILERRGPVVIGSPCSGHGFKFAPVVGERLAGLAAEVV